MKTSEFEKYLESLRKQYPLKNNIRLSINNTLKRPCLTWVVEKKVLQEFVIELPLTPKRMRQYILHEYFHAKFMEEGLPDTTAEMKFPTQSLLIPTQLALISRHYNQLSMQISEVPLEIFLHRLQRDYTIFRSREMANAVSDCSSAVSELAEIEKEGKAGEKKEIVMDLYAKMYHYVVSLAAIKVIARHANLKNITNQISRLEPSLKVLGVDSSGAYEIYAELFEQISEKDHLNKNLLKHAVEKAVKRSEGLSEKYRKVFFAFLPIMPVTTLNKDGILETIRIADI